ENARLATESTKKENGADGGARLFLAGLERLYKRYPSLEVHVVAHSAGAIFMAPLVARLTAPRNAGGLGRTVATWSLWAPACSTRCSRRTRHNGSDRRTRRKKGRPAHPPPNITAILMTMVRRCSGLWAASRACAFLPTRFRWD